MGRRLEIIVITALIALFFAWFACPLIWSASDNLRMVDAFDVDEALHLIIVKNALEAQSFRLMFNNYGHLYFNAALIPLFIMDRIIDVTEQHMVVVLRMIPALFAAYYGPDYSRVRRLTHELPPPHRRTDRRAGAPPAEIPP